jgi:hypothetical protein
MGCVDVSADIGKLLWMLGEMGPVKVEVVNVVVPVVVGDISEGEVEDSSDMIE